MTLFLIAINSLFSAVPKFVKVIIYADDIIIYISGKSHKAIRKRLQQTLESLEKWSLKTGFRISHEKTTSMHVCRKRSHQDTPALKLEGFEIKQVQTMRILGMVFDSRLNWTAHIDKIKADVEPRINILRSISGNRLGGHPKVMLNIYKAIIQSKLLFGAPIYNGASDAQLKKLDACQNKAIRISIGAFATSPIDSIMSISGILPLKYLIWETSVKNLISLSSVKFAENRSFAGLERARDIAMSKLDFEIPNIETYSTHPKGV